MFEYLYILLESEIMNFKLLNNYFRWKKVHPCESQLRRKY